ncbi:tyrosine-type recombinase/integrase [Streptococcus merionis]|nr:tyrosine-type recombinase/integrase [Streptococcus merionis]
MTSHSFQEVLSRVEKELHEHCEERYGFKWTKHITSHPFRHMHITYLQNGNSGVALKEIMERVGHVNVETTVIYTHKTMDSQAESITALDNFVKDNSFDFKELKVWKCKYSPAIYSEVIKHEESKSIHFDLNEFRDLIGIHQNYSPRHIAGNIIPKIKTDVGKYIDSFNIVTLKESGHK